MPLQTQERRRAYLRVQYMSLSRRGQAPQLSPDFNSLVPYRLCVVTSPVQPTIRYCCSSLQISALTCTVILPFHGHSGYACDADGSIAMANSTCVTHDAQIAEDLLLDAGAVSFRLPSNGTTVGMGYCVMYL